MPTPVEIALNLTKTGDGATQAATELELASQAAQTLADKAVEGERVQQKWNQSLDQLSPAGLEKIEAQLTAVIAETEKAGGSTTALQAKLGDVQQKLVSTGDAARSTAASYRDLDKGAAAANTGSSNLASTLVRQLAPAAAALKLKSLATEALAYAEGIKDAGERTGVTTDEVQRLTYAANQNATSWSELESGLKNLAVQVEGNEAKLTALGISAKDTEGKARPLRDILGDFAEVVANTEDPTKRTALAVQFLGRSGQSLVPLLLQGRAGLKAFGDEAERTGRVIDSGTIKKLDESKQRLDDFNQRVTIISGQLAAHFMELGEQIGETAADFLNGLEGLPDGIAATAEKAAAGIGTAEAKTRSQIEQTIATLARLKQARIEAYDQGADTAANEILRKANETIEADAEAKRTPEEKAARARSAREGQYQQDVTNIRGRTAPENQAAATDLLTRARDIDLAKIEADAKAERARLDAEAAKKTANAEAAATKAKASQDEQAALGSVGAQAGAFQAGARTVAGEARERGDTGLQSAAKALNDAALAAQIDGTTLEEARNLVAAAENLGKEMKARKQESATMAALLKSATEALKGLRN